MFDSIVKEIWCVIFLPPVLNISTKLAWCCYFSKIYGVYIYIRIKEFSWFITLWFSEITPWKKSWNPPEPHSLRSIYNICVHSYYSVYFTNGFKFLISSICSRDLCREKFSCLSTFWFTEKVYIIYWSSEIIFGIKWI